MEEMLFHNIQEAQKRSLAEQVAEQINQLIIDRNLNAGDKLPNEFELAESLNVGRGTIREAIKQLVARNCLEIRRGKGTFVKEKTGMVEDPFGFAYVADKVKLAKELMEIRMRLEPWIASLAAQNIEEDEKDVMKKLCDRVEDYIDRGEEHAEVDREYHTYIAKCTHNSVIPELIPVITHSVALFTKMKDKELLNITKKTHREVQEAICANDSKAAEEAMKRHIMANSMSIPKLNDMKL